MGGGEEEGGGLHRPADEILRDVPTRRIVATARDFGRGGGSRSLALALVLGAVVLLEKKRVPGVRRVVKNVVVVHQGVDRKGVVDLVAQVFQDGADDGVASRLRRRGARVRPRASRALEVLEEVEGVFVLMDGVARFRPVRTGITGDMDIEVLDGLTSGQEVVVGPYQKLRKLSEWDRAVVDEKRQKAAASARRP